MTQTLWSPISTRVVAQMNTIPNIGQVHDRLRLATQAGDVDAEIVAEIDGIRRIRAWYVDLKDIETKRVEAGGSTEWWRTISIEGRMDFEDATGSELLIVDFTERIIRTLANDARATRFDGNILGHRPPQLVDKTPRPFASVMCGYARIEMRVWTIETPV